MTLEKDILEILIPYPGQRKAGSWAEAEARKKVAEIMKCIKKEVEASFGFLEDYGEEVYTRSDGVPITFK